MVYGMQRFMTKATVILLISIFLISGLPSCSQSGIWDQMKAQYYLVSQGLIWETRVPIDIDVSYLSAPISNFPVLVRLHRSDVPTGFLSVDGDDLQFRDADGESVLPHEIDEWNPLGESLIWVRVPLLTPESASVRIYLYAGNDNPRHNPRSREVWDENFAAVFHLSAGGDVVPDSSRYQRNALTNSKPVSNDPELNLDGVNNRTILAPNPIAAVVGTGYRIDSADSGIIIPEEKIPQEFSQMTVSAWVKLDDIDSSEYSGRRIAHMEKIEFRLQGGERYYIEAYTSGDNLKYSRNSFLDRDQWVYTAISWNGQTGGQAIVRMSRGVMPGMAGNFSFHASIADQISGSGNLTGHLDNPWAIGNSISGGSGVPAVLDEVRISSVTRSSDWLLTEYLNMAGNIVTVGTPETLQYDF